MRIAVVGATRARGADWEGAPLVRSIASWDPHALLLTGGCVSKGTQAEWDAWRERWSSLEDQAVGVLDSSARKRDRSLTRWREAKIGGQVDDLPGSTWTAGTLVSSGVRWRVVVLDTEREALGARWLDERSWLPKVIADRGDYDHLILVTGRPLASLEHPTRPESPAVQDLLEQVAEHTAPGTLLAVISGGTATNEVLLHSGSFGEVNLVAGNGAVPAQDLSRRGESSLPSVGELSLVDGYDKALLELWGARTTAPVQNRYLAGTLPLRGWWKVEIDGDAISLAFQLEAEDHTFDEVYRILYTRTMGWVAARTAPD